MERLRKYRHESTLEHKAASHSLSTNLNECMRVERDSIQTSHLSKIYAHEPDLPKKKAINKRLN